MIDHTPEIDASDITAEEREAYNDFRTRLGISRFTKLERSSFIHGYRAAKAANKALLQELLEVYMTAVNSAYCQVPEDQGLTVKIQDFLGDSK